MLAPPSIAFHLSSPQWKMPNQLKQFAVSKVLAIKVAHSTLAYPHLATFSSYQSIKCLLINRTVSRRTDNYPDVVRQLLWLPNGNRTPGTGHSNAATNCVHKLCSQPFWKAQHLWYFTFFCTRYE